MNLFLHNRRGAAVTDQFSIQTEDGLVLLLFNIPPKSPLRAKTVLAALEECPGELIADVIRAQRDEHDSRLMDELEKEFGPFDGQQPGDHATPTDDMKRETGE